MRLSEKEGEVRLLFHVHQVNLIFVFLFTPLLDFLFIFVAQFEEVCEVFYLMFFGK